MGLESGTSSSSTEDLANKDSISTAVLPTYLDPSLPSHMHAQLAHTSSPFITPPTSPLRKHEVVESVPCTSNPNNQQYVPSDNSVTRSSDVYGDVERTTRAYPPSKSSDNPRTTGKTFSFPKAIVRRKSFSNSPSLSPPKSSHSPYFLEQACSRASGDGRCGHRRSSLLSIFHRRGELRCNFIVFFFWSNFSPLYTPQQESFI